MTRLIFSADQHVGATHLTTLADQATAIGEVIAAANRADALLLGGDATHHARPTPEALRVWGEALGRCTVPVIAVAGNHDGPEVVRLFESFRGKVIVATDPRIIPLNGIDIACLPWLPDAYLRAAAGGSRTRDETALALSHAATAILAGFVAHRRPGRPMILLTHGTVAGAVTSGEWNMGYRPSTYYVLLAEEVAPFDLVLAGHIHRHQDIGNVVYSGSLQPLDFSETEPKGFLDVAIDRMAGPRPWVHVPVTSPRVLSIALDGPADIERLAFAAPETIAVAGAVVRVRVNVDEATARAFPPAQIRAAFTAAGARLVQVELAIIRSDRARDAGMTADIGPIAAFNRYMATRDDLAAAVRERMREGAGTIVATRETDPTHVDGDLTIETIEAVNLLGVADATVDLSAGGVYALTGPVGAGKSTIGADAVRLALFGTHRGGVRPTAGLVRIGADHAMAAVTLRAADGNRYRIVRQVKSGRGGRSSSTVDVMTANGSGWVPVGPTAKLADATASIDGILGGLDDATLTSSSIVVQRAADLFTRGDPSDRKAMLARAAGLGIYDDLATMTRDRASGSQRAYDVAMGRLDPLRSRVAGRAELEAAHALAVRERDAAAVELGFAVGALDAIAADPRIDETRERVTSLEAELSGHGAALTAHTLADRARLDRVAELKQVREQRRMRSAELDRAHTRATAAAARLTAAACCAPEPSCVLLDATRSEAAVIGDIEIEIAANAEPSDDEGRLVQAIAAMVVPPMPDLDYIRHRLTTTRETLRELELAGARAMADARARVDGVRRNIASAETRIAHAAGRLEEIRAAAAALADAETAVTAASFDLAAWTELGAAWRACRVSVLETSVIPSVENIANEILRRFPYGLQVGLNTQRNTTAGGIAETLDVAVIGGHGAVYELCSGGQRTCIDFAFHVAIAIVVARRATSRLRYLFADEPEGLDEPGRMAFAAIARWVHATFGVTVVVASHAPDLIDALGGTRIDVVPGPDGAVAVRA